MNNVDILVSVVFAPNGCRERDRMANEKNRDNSKMTLMEKYPDWDWDYWGCQIE